MANPQQQNLKKLIKPTTNQYPQELLEERGKRIKLAAELGLARSSGGRLWARALRRRLRRPSQHKPSCIVVKNSAPLKNTESQEKVEGGEEIEEKVKALQRLVPGGDEMQVERLFEETADYIEALREQVSVMRALAGLLNGLDSEQRLNEKDFE
ncbi:hypothetical protein LUZ60_000654 [Juncus effusus]|nr:hypothetical protein LUZ60_000654 [Juncus effusus]